MEKKDDNNIKSDDINKKQIKNMHKISSKKNNENKKKKEKVKIIYMDKKIEKWMTILSFIFIIWMIIFKPTVYNDIILIDDPEYPEHIKKAYYFNDPEYVNKSRTPNKKESN